MVRKWGGHIHGERPVAFNPAKIAAVRELGLSNSAGSGGEVYREEWRFFYAERRRLLIRLLWLAGGLGVFGCLLFTAPVDRFPRVAQITIALPFGLFLIALPVQWFLFVWQMGTWPCPRCAKRFFLSIFAFDPFFGVRCRHCGLLRLRKSEVNNEQDV